MCATVGAAMGPTASSRLGGKQWIFPEGCPEFNCDDVPEMEQVYQEIKVSTGMYCCLLVSISSWPSLQLLELER